MRKNTEVAKILYQIADLLEIENVQWKPAAYRKAAQSVESAAQDIDVLVKEQRLHELSGVGEHIATKIKELVATGKLQYLEKLKKEVPIDVESLSKIEGLGPKTLKNLWKQLKIKNLEDLKKAAETRKLAQVEGIGEKKQQQILERIQRMKTQGPERMLLGHAAPIAEEIAKILKAIKGVQQVKIAGSYRRGKETVGDIDILVSAVEAKRVMDFFVSMSGVAEILAQGATKSSVRMENGLQVDIRVVQKEQWGSALQYFTGSKEHSVALRTIAVKKGLTLSEYGLFTIKGKKVVASKTEEEIYNKLGLQYIPPEMRENRGEIALAQKKKIPTVIELKDINGDFQTQTTWSDGAHSIEEMAKKGEQLGWKFITITDHVGGIGITNPLDEKRLQKQAEMIDKLNKKMNIHIFKGAEIDITKTGALALAKKACKKLDVVLASIHSSFRMPQKEMTARICTALENYPVHILGHPTGRLINRRNPLDFDADKVFETAKERGMFLEINGQPSRMDLNDVLVHKARESGCSFVISSDAHAIDQLEYVKYGILTARRGWLEKKDVLNTKSVKEIEKVLRR